MLHLGVATASHLPPSRPIPSALFGHISRLLAFLLLLQQTEYRSLKLFKSWQLLVL